MMGISVLNLLTFGYDGNTGELEIKLLNRGYTDVNLNE